MRPLSGVFAVLALVGCDRDPCDYDAVPIGWDAAPWTPTTVRFTPDWSDWALAEHPWAMGTEVELDLVPASGVDPVDVVSANGVCEGFQAYPLTGQVRIGSAVVLDDATPPDPAFWKAEVTTRLEVVGGVESLEVDLVADWGGTSVQLSADASDTIGALTSSQTREIGFHGTFPAPNGEAFRGGLGLTHEQSNGETGQRSLLAGSALVVDGFE